MPNTTAAPKKLRDRKAVLLRLWGYLRCHPWMVFAALILTLVSNVLALIGPALSGRAIDAIGTEAGKVNFDTVFFYCALMLIIYLVSSILSYLLSVLMIHLSQKVIYRMRAEVFNRLSELPVGYFDSHQTGDIISRISYDIDTVNSSLSNDLLQIVTSAITVLGSLLMMLIISPQLVLVFAVTVPISVVLTAFMTRRVRPLFRKRSIELGELNGFAEEILTGQKTTKAYHQEKTMAGRFDAKNETALNAYFKADYYGSMTGPSVNFINNLSLALISIFGALLFLARSLSLGELSSFVLYSRKFSGPINEAANILSELQSACSAAERVFRLIDEPAEPADSQNAKVVENVVGEISVEHLKFGYSPNATIINDLNLRAEPGSLVAVVGPTGAGKTTLINLLMRFYDPEGGCIRLDGCDIKAVTRKSLRLAYAMVLQDTWLFHGSIFDNIAYGKKGATMEEVVEVAKAARLHNYISHLPDGYNTIITEDGVNISQGQKQLLTIARAMLLDANLLILDEATSNVDTRTELQTQLAMRTLMRGKTCFVIAHRLSTIQNADVILVVENGDIVEQGKHDDLMASGGVYSALYQAQFQ